MGGNENEELTKAFFEQAAEILESMLPGMAYLETPKDPMAASARDG